MPPDVSSNISPEDSSVPAADQASDDLERDDLRRLRLFLYLIPVVGFVPALLSLYRKVEDRREQQVSRLAVVLALAWVLTVSLCGIGSSLSETPPLMALVFSSMLTSSYFLTSLWLMVQLWRRKRLWLPGMSAIGERLP